MIFFEKLKITSSKVVYVWLLLKVIADYVENIYANCTDLTIQRKYHASEYKVYPECVLEVQSNIRTCKLCKCKLIKSYVSDDVLFKEKDISPINPYEHSNGTH